MSCVIAFTILTGAVKDSQLRTSSSQNNRETYVSEGLLGKP